MYKIYLPLFFLTSFLCAQSISYEEALNLTLKNNKDLKKQEQDILLSKEDINYINSMNYGSLYLQEEISRTNHSGYVFNSKLSSREASFRDFGFIQQNQGIDVQPKDLNYPKARTNFNSKIAYDIPLFTGYKLKRQEDILKLKEKALSVKLKLTKKALSYEVLKAYNSAVVSKEYIKATKKAKEAISYVVKSAKAFHKDGLVTKIDVKQALVYNFNINAKLIEANNKFNLSLAYLKFLTSKESINDVKKLKNINIKTKDKLFQKALNNRDEIQIQLFQNSAYKKNISLNKSSYYPSIASHLEYGFNDDSLNLASQKDYYMAVLAVKFTLFDKTRKALKQKSKIEYIKANLDLEKLKDSIKLELNKSLLDLKAKNKILKAKNEAKNLALEVFEQATLMYKNQLIPMTNLLEQEANLRKNEADYIMAKYDKSLASAKLALVLGYDFTNIIKENND